MKRLICKLIGHAWKEQPGTRDLKYAAPYCVCLRCGEKGWRL